MAPKISTENLYFTGWNDYGRSGSSWLQLINKVMQQSMALS
jgi:hypothetical protein